MFPFALFALAKKDIYKTLLESGNIKFIFIGDSLKRIIADVRGEKIDGHKLVTGTETRTWLEKRFGVFHVGIPPFASVKTFKIQRRKEEEEFAGKPPKDWIRDLGETEVSSLREKFPIPFLLPDAELGDRQTVNAVVVGKFKVVDAYIPVVQLKGNFYELTASTCKAAFNDIFGRRSNTLEVFLQTDKGEGGILSELLNPSPSQVSGFNRILEERVGLHLVGATIPQWDPSDPKVREAMTAKFIAEKAGEAALVAAGIYKQETEIKSQADADAIKRKAEARGIHVQRTLEAIATRGGTPDELVRAATGILRAESLPHLTTLVEGGASAVVSVGGGRQ